MRRARRRWDLPDTLSGAGSILERVLAARGLVSLDVLNGTGHDHDPFLLTDMDRAVSLVEAAVRERAPIAIYGDYDADGVTASALLVRVLRAGGMDPIAYIPNRESEGYGLNAQALEDLASRGARLVITVDCGTTGIEVVEGRPPGMRLLITDHHLPRMDPATGGALLAPADALVNPQRPGNRYPFAGLAGVGVAYKLAQALELRGLIPSGSAARQLPLAALGTVADMMPLLDENRFMVRHGLQAWVDSAPLGLLALARAAGMEGTPSSSDLAFSIGPRINAAGRMEDASLALQCLLEDSPDEASRSAMALEQMNRDRRAALAEALAIARPLVAALPEEAPSIVIGSPHFAAGVVGLIAGRLAEEFQRPTFVYSMSGAEWKGSARGVADLNVVAVLSACSEGLVRFGGHRGAGGFTLPAGEAHALRFAALVDAAVTAQIGSRNPCRVFRADAVIRMSECNLKLSDELAELGPFGMGNPKVLLCSLACRIVSAEMFGRSEDHLRVVLDDGTAQMEAIAFNRPGISRHLPPGRVVDTLYELEADRWRGRERLRLLLRDLRPVQR